MFGATSRTQLGRHLGPTQPDPRRATLARSLARFPNFCLTTSRYTDRPWLTFTC